MGQLPGQQNWLEWQSKKWFKWDHNGAPSVWSKQNLNMAKYNVIEIEGLLFPGFGQMQVRKFFPSSDVMRALKMELFSWKILSTLMFMMSLDGKNRLFSWKICAPAFSQTPGIANLLFQITLGRVITPLTSVTEAAYLPKEKRIKLHRIFCFTSSDLTQV